jgi:hypothetical protein
LYTRVDRVEFEINTGSIDDYSRIPETPINLSPEVNDIIFTLEPTFQWSPFLDGGDGDERIGYQIRVRSDNDNDEIVYDTGLIDDIAETSHVYSPGNYTGLDVLGQERVSNPLEWDKIYHWHVRYLDSGGEWSQWSSDEVNNYHWFTTANTPQLYGGIISPTIGAIDQDFTFKVRYESEAGIQPTNPIVVIDEQEYSMTLDSDDGHTKVFSRVLSNFAPGDHQAIFKINASGNDLVTPSQDSLIFTVLNEVQSFEIPGRIEIELEVDTLGNVTFKSAEGIELLPLSLNLPVRVNPNASSDAEWSKASTWSNFYPSLPAAYLSVNVVINVKRLLATGGLDPFAYEALLSTSLDLVEELDNLGPDEKEITFNLPLSKITGGDHDYMDRLIEAGFESFVNTRLRMSFNVFLDQPNVDVKLNKDVTINNLQVDQNVLFNANGRQLNIRDNLVNNGIITNINGSVGSIISNTGSLTIGSGSTLNTGDIIVGNGEVGLSGRLIMSNDTNESSYFDNSVALTNGIFESKAQNASFSENSVFNGNGDFVGVLNSGLKVINASSEFDFKGSITRNGRLLLTESSRALISNYKLENDGVIEVRGSGSELELSVHPSAGNGSTNEILGGGLVKVTQGGLLELHSERDSFGKNTWSVLGVRVEVDEESELLSMGSGPANQINGQVDIAGALIVNRGLNLNQGGIIRGGIIGTDLIYNGDIETIDLVNLSRLELEIKSDRYFIADNISNAISNLSFVSNSEDQCTWINSIDSTLIAKNNIDFSHSLSENQLYSCYSEQIDSTFYSVAIGNGNAILNEPINDVELITSENPSLSWYDVIYSEDYLLKISADEEFNELIKDTLIVSNNSYSLPENLSEAQYFWKIENESPQLNEYSSDVRSFRISNGIPEIPLSIYPTDTVNNANIPTIFTWNKVELANEYRVQVFEQNSSNSVVDTVVIDTTFKSNELKYLNQYSWRLRSLGNYGESDWSVLSTFSTKTKPNTSPYIVSVIEEIVLNEDFNPVYEIDLSPYYNDDEIIYDDSLRYNLINSSDILVPLIFDDRLILNPIKDSFGQDTLILEVYDTKNLSISDSIFISIQPINDAPIINHDSLYTVNEGDSIRIDLTKLITDIDDSFAKLDISSSFINASIDSLNLVSEIVVNELLIKSKGEDNYTSLLKISATDTSGASANDTLNISVIGINDPPVLLDHKLAFNLTEDFTDTLSIFGDSLFYDPDSEFKLSVTSQHSLVDYELNFDSTSVLINSVQNAFGVDTLILKAKDSEYETTSNIPVSVLPVNDAPEWLALEKVMMPEETDFRVNLTSQVQDVDDDSTGLVFQVLNQDTLLQAGLETEIEGQTELILVPAVDTFGEFELQLMVLDTSLAADTTSAFVTVQNVNDIPVLSSKYQAPALLEDFQAFKLGNLDTLYFDVEGDSLQFEISQNGSIVQAAIDSVNHLVLSPIEHAFGTDTLVIRIQDSEDLISDSLYFAIQPINDPPVLSGLPDSLVFENDSTVILNLDEYVQDVDDPKEALRWEFAASSASILTELSEQRELYVSTPDYIGRDSLFLAVYDTSEASASDNILVNALMPTNNELVGDIPEEFSLSQNYPNPFNPSTNIRIGLPETSDVEIVIYNLLGQRVQTVLDQRMTAGYHSIRIEMATLATGIYLYQMRSNNFVQTKKLMLVK